MNRPFENHKCPASANLGGNCGRNLHSTKNLDVTLNVQHNQFSIPADYLQMVLEVAGLLKFRRYAISTRPVEIRRSRVGSTYRRPVRDTSIFRAPVYL